MQIRQDTSYNSFDFGVRLLFDRHDTLQVLVTSWDTCSQQNSYYKLLLLSKNMFLRGMDHRQLLVLDIGNQPDKGNSKQYPKNNKIGKVEILLFFETFVS